MVVVCDVFIDREKKRRVYRCDFEGCNKVYIKSSYLKVYRRIYIGIYILNIVIEFILFFCINI